MKVRLALSALLGLACLLPAAAVGHASPGRHGVLIPSQGTSLDHVGTTVDSLNWAGYADLAPSGHRITAVTSTFKVPAVNGTTPGFAATWTGIGGFNTQDLIQAGVEEDSLSAALPSYNAWYEILPASETPVSRCSGDSRCTVRPGDTVTVSIATTGIIQKKQTWKISIVDSGHWSFAKSLTYTSSYSSAEWILEAPTVGAQTVMPMMGVSHFDPNTFALDRSTPHVLSTGHPVKIT